jgi:two-component system OmpR family sensor kinase
VNPSAGLDTPFGRRLQFISALEIAAVLWLLVFGVALFAFGSFAQSLTTDVSGQLQQSMTILRSGNNATSADRAARAISSGYLRSGIIVLLFDRGDRIELYRGDRADPHITVHHGKRGQPAAQPEPTGALAQIVLGLATAFGVSTARGQVGSIELVMRASDMAVVNAVEPFAWPLVFALAVVSILGFAIARTLTRQALRPLIEVQAALERFASGDLRPQPIAADRRSSLGGLAVAYNGAIEQMQRAFAERERADASMRQFIADAGHQLRTPLTVLRGFIAILRKGDLRTPADREHILETMHRQSALMGSLIDKLMLLDRWEDETERVVAEPIDIARLVEDVVAPLAEARPERVVRVAAHSGDLVAIDPIDLSHAMTNIVDNALKYTGGPIDIAIARTGGKAAITVRDRGPGMCSADVAHAFDRFFRGTRRDVDGTGLGLAIAKRAIERAGGSIALESSVEAGSLFTITLPLATNTRPAPDPVGVA